MDRHFALPIAVSAAFHVALLFGYRPEIPSVVATTAPERPRISDPFPVALADPPEPMRSDEPAAKAAPTVEPPRGEEPPHLPPIDKDFTIPRWPHPGRRVDGPVIQIPPGGGGPGNGVPHEIFTSVGLDNPPRTRAQPAPVYPFEAKRTGLTGTVILEFVVDESGHVLEPRVIESSDRAFEEPAMRAVLKWRFEPGRKDGRIVRFRMSQPFQFRLDGE